MKELQIVAVVLGMPCIVCAAPEFFEVEYGDPPDHLEPVSARSSEYEKKLADKLLVTPYNCGLMVTRPSFEGESAVAVYEIISSEILEKHGSSYIMVPNEEKQFFITATVADQNIFYSLPEQNDEKIEKAVEVSRVDVEISANLALAIQQAWAQAAMRTKYPGNSYGGDDGTNYEFGVYVRGLGTLRGRTWSPHKGALNRLVTMGKKLESMAKEGKSPDDESEKDLIRELDNFGSLYRSGDLLPQGGIVVAGAVPQAKTFQASPNFSLSEALAACGGMQEDANTSAIAVHRADKVIEINLKTINGIRVDGEFLQNGTFLLEAGDVVVVPKVEEKQAEVEWSEVYVE